MGAWLRMRIWCWVFCVGMEESLDYLRWLSVAIYEGSLADAMYQPVSSSLAILIYSFLQSDYVQDIQHSCRLSSYSIHNMTITNTSIHLHYPTRNLTPINTLLSSNQPFRSALTWRYTPAPLT